MCLQQFLFAGTFAQALIVSYYVHTHTLVSKLMAYINNAKLINVAMCQLEKLSQDLLHILTSA